MIRMIHYRFMLPTGLYIVIFEWTVPSSFSFIRTWYILSHNCGKESNDIFFSNGSVMKSEVSVMRVIRSVSAVISHETLCSWCFVVLLIECLASDWCEDVSYTPDVCLHIKSDGCCISQLFGVRAGCFFRITTAVMFHCCVSFALWRFN